MADHEGSSTKHLNGSTGRSGIPKRSEHRRHGRYKFENRFYDSHGPFREQHAPPQGYPHADRHTSDWYDKSEDRHSGSIVEHRPRNPHEPASTINRHSHERIDGVDHDLYGRETLNEPRTTNSNTTHDRRRPVHDQEAAVESLQERYNSKDEPDLGKHVYEKRRHRDDEGLQKKDHYRFNHKEKDQQYRESRSPACGHSYFSPDLREVDQSNTLNEQQSDHRFEHGRHRYHRESFSASPADENDNSLGPRTPKRASASGRHPSHRGRQRSRSPSRTRSRSRSRTPSRSRSRVPSHRRSPSGSHRRGRSRTSSPVSRSSHSGKRKQKDRSTSRDDRKRRKHKERGKEKDREKEKTKKRDEERRSVLTGKKIKLKVKKDKGDHERDANRKDLLQFLNSAFE